MTAGRSKRFSSILQRGSVAEQSGVLTPADNVLRWAQHVLIPVDVDEFSIEALELLLGQVQTQGLRKFPGSPNWCEDAAGWGG
jgi:hypothetical protein